MVWYNDKNIRLVIGLTLRIQSLFSYHWKSSLYSITKLKFIVVTVRTMRKSIDHDSFAYTQYIRKNFKTNECVAK